MVVLLVDSVGSKKFADFYEPSFYPWICNFLLEPSHSRTEFCGLVVSIDPFHCVTLCVVLSIPCIVFVQRTVQEISQNSQENTCGRVWFFIKLQGSAWNFIKRETLAQMFSCEFCEISKNTFCYRTPPVAASVFTDKSLTPWNVLILCSEGRPWQLKFFEEF